MKLMLRVLLVLCLSLATVSTVIASTPSTTLPRIPLVQSVDVQVPVAPAPVTIAGKPHLAYELHVTNLVSDAAVLTGVDVLDDARSSKLLELDGEALADRISRPGLRGEAVDKLTIGGGMRAVVYFWLPVDEVPATLRHRIAFERVNGEDSKAAVFEAAVVNVKPEPPAELAPPLRGGPWLAAYGPQWERGHRRFIYTIDGQARIPARYAIDWIGLDESGSTSHGDASHAENWHGHGAEVLAVADAVVADARDDIPPPESVGVRQANLPLENHSGNYVILDLGDGRHAVYEHLQHGSVRVRTGEKVESGQVIGQLGNTGSSSSGPHLHFHVADANASLAAEGLPYGFRNFEVIGEYRTFADARRGEPWNPATTGGDRKRELPAANTVIMFADQAGSFVSGTVDAAEAPVWQEDGVIGELFDEAGVEGTFVLLDTSAQRMTGYNLQRAEQRFVPASTFKIPNTLIGLSAGAIESVDDVLPYGGKPQPFAVWEHDMNLREAIGMSNAAIYQELARRIGTDTMQDAIDRLAYGNRRIGDVIDQFWLLGPLEISAIEQVGFLARLATGELPFPARHMATTRDIIRLEQRDGAVLYGKTGWQNAPKPGVGWWVGWVERGDDIQVFALNIDIREPADAKQRILLGTAALEHLGVLHARDR